MAAEEKARVGDGVWLYIEQAAAERLAKPYRQRGYCVTQSEDDSYTSEVLSIPDPLRFAGTCKDPKPLASLTPDSIEAREGCAVVLDWKENEGFVGEPVGKGVGATFVLRRSPRRRSSSLPID